MSTSPSRSSNKPPSPVQVALNSDLDIVQTNRLTVRPPAELFSDSADPLPSVDTNPFLSNSKEDCDQFLPQPQVDEEPMDGQKEEGEKISEGLEVVKVTVEVRDKKKDENIREDDHQGKNLFFVYGGNYPETIVNALIPRGNWAQCKNEKECIERCAFVWRPFNYGPEGYKRIDKRLTKNPQAPLVYNHFEVIKGLITKSGLIKSLKQFYYNNELARQASYSVFDTTPTTFLLTSGIEDCEYKEFVQRYRDINKGYAPKERIPLKHCMNNIWLVKPTNANQGRGIEIFSDLSELLHFINTRPQYTVCVVQKYVERPLLYKQRKFDIRVWALVTNKFEIFFYKKGYLRTSSDFYSLNNGNNYVHLTNNCLQKHGEKYGTFEDGNTIGFEAFQEYLDENYPQYKLTVEEHFIPRMRDLIIDTFQSTKHQLNPQRRKNCFELLGYDFLVDEDLRIWLIEVNTNPYFGVPNEYIANLLPKMADELMSIVCDPIYPPETPSQIKQGEGNFELIYCEGNSTYCPGPISKRRPFNTPIYPVADFAQLSGPKAPKQDIKVLKQYKINNFQISTVSFKTTKDKPEPIYDDGVHCSQRSKSLIHGHQKTSQKLKNHTMRSKSIVKNTGTASTDQLNIQDQSSYANKKSLYLKPTITSTCKQVSTSVLSKTPKQHNHTFKTSKQSYLLSSSNFLDPTDRQTPCNLSINGLSRKYGKKTITTGESERDHSKLGRRTTLCSSTNAAQDLSSNTSSSQQQETQLLSQVKEFMGSNKIDKQSKDFEQVFQKVIERIRVDGSDDSKTQQNQELLQMFIKQEKIHHLYKEHCVETLIRMAFDQEVKLTQQMQQFMMDYFQKLSEKFQVCQILIKQKYILYLLRKYQLSESEQVKGCIFRILVNVSCIKDMKAVKLQQLSVSPRFNRIVSGVMVIKETQYETALEKGLLLLIIAQQEKYKNLISQELQQVITEADIEKLISQIDNYKSQKLGIKTSDQKELNFQFNCNVAKRMNTDTDLNLESHKQNEEIDEYKDTSFKKEQFNSMIKSQQIDSRRDKSRSERVEGIVSEKRVNISVRQSPKLEKMHVIPNLPQNKEVIEKIFEIIETDIAEKQCNELLQKVIERKKNEEIQNQVKASEQQDVAYSPQKLLISRIQQELMNQKKATYIQNNSQSFSNSPKKLKNHGTPNSMIQQVTSNSVFHYPAHLFRRTGQDSLIQSQQRTVIHTPNKASMINSIYQTPEKESNPKQMFDFKKDSRQSNIESEVTEQQIIVLQEFLTKTKNLDPKNTPNQKNARSFNNRNVNHLNQAIYSKQNQNSSYLQETQCSQKKKIIAQKFTPVLKDQKFEVQTTIAMIPYDGLDSKRKINNGRQHQQSIKNTIFIGSQSKKKSGGSRASSRGSSCKNIQSKRESASSLKEMQNPTMSKQYQRYSQIQQNPYCNSPPQSDGYNMFSKKSQISDSKRPPLHNNYVVNAQSENQNEEVSHNLCTYESNPDDLSSTNKINEQFINGLHSQQETRQCNINNDNLGNLTMILDLSSKNAINGNEKCGWSASARNTTNGPAISNNFFYPKKQGDVSIKSTTSGSQMVQLTDDQYTVCSGVGTQKPTGCNYNSNSTRQKDVSCTKISAKGSTAQAKDVPLNLRLFMKQSSMRDNNNDVKKKVKQCQHKAR